MDKLFKPSPKKLQLESLKLFQKDATTKIAEIKKKVDDVLGKVNFVT